MKSCDKCQKPNAPVAIQCVHCGVELARDLTPSQWEEVSGTEGRPEPVSERTDARADGGLCLLKGLGFCAVTALLSLATLGLNALAGRQGIYAFLGTSAAGIVYILIGLFQIVTGIPVGKRFDQMHGALKLLILAALLLGVGYGIVAYFNYLMPH